MKIEEKNVTIKNDLSVLLRSVAAEDAQMMLDHLKISHRESFRNMNQSAFFWETFSVEQESKILADFLSAPGKFMIAAVLDGKIIGGLGLVGNMAEFTKHCASLGMSIQLAYCNSGLGTEMMIHALDMAKANGFHRIELTVRTYNKAGIALYEKLGFEKIGMLKNAAFINGRYENEYSYQKLLV